MIITILLWLVFGAVIGWVAGLIMKSKKSLLWNIIFGIVGSIVGGFIASLLGFGSLGGAFSFNIVSILISIGGACLVIWLATILKIGK
ncbi:MAG: GlsB/YeaQ/YmgE family stress response membrane protein [Oscillospiraceae bacterium]|nr:GlsB/YeaQ/YmgE family stress response membrane protein [Oscillospiraceae bacterium]